MTPVKTTLVARVFLSETDPSPQEPGLSLGFGQQKAL